MHPIMTKDMPRTVEHMFKLMDARRHLPKYKLELRLAPFFELFLGDVLGECLRDELHGVGLHPVIIPEFPLRKGTLRDSKGTLKDNGSNQSYNVDYVAFSKDLRDAFLVELKTDMSSISKAQKENLSLARDIHLGPLVCGVIKICQSKYSMKAKYVHLLHRLAKLELVKIPDELYQETFPSPQDGWWNDAFKGVELKVEGKLERTQIIYIQPRKPESGQGVTYIDFSEVAKVVQRFGDIGYVFARYLRKWKEDPG